jgi:hypothetical protein
VRPAKPTTGLRGQDEAHLVARLGVVVAARDDLVAALTTLSDGPPASRPHRVRSMHCSARRQRLLGAPWEAPRVSMAVLAPNPSRVSCPRLASSLGVHGCSSLRRLRWCGHRGGAETKRRPPEDGCSSVVGRCWGSRLCGTVTRAPTVPGVGSRSDAHGVEMLVRGIRRSLASYGSGKLTDQRLVTP